MGGVELSKTQINETSYGFGGTGTNYDFVVTYYANGQDGQSDECFVWDINVAVTKDAPVSLTYTVKLTNPQTSAGTYGQYDADGSEGYTGLYTNNSATLFPVDSKGNHGASEVFSKPAVSYTVEGGGSTGGGTYYDLTVNYYDQDTGEKIAKSYTDSIRKGRSYHATAYDAIAIEGYTYVETTGDALTGTMNSDKVINVYYTAEESDIDDGDTPLGPGPDGEVDIDDGDTPKGDGSGLDDGTEIIDGETPMGDLPQTGTAEAVNPFATAGFMALAAAMAAAGLVLTRTKSGKREED